jgi:hypothetical protein
MTREEAERLKEKGGYLVGKKVTVRDINKLTYKYDTIEYTVREIRISCSPDTLGNFDGKEVCTAYAVLVGLRDSQEIKEGLLALIAENPPEKFKS